MKQVIFDEQHLFPFGEAIGRQSAFRADEATAWGPGYSWEELAPLFDVLLAEGVIERGDPPADPKDQSPVPSLLSPSVCPSPRFWATETSPGITKDLGGRAVEVGYLETMLSVYRVAHAALDADNRQVGEANVYPPGLRLDRPTEWRTCQYAGSRYRQEVPMNVTALRAMIKHWKGVIKTFLLVRQRVLELCPRSANGWTVGDLHTLAAVVLTLPAYQLMRGGGQVPQPPLHPILSSLFRITDGIHMTTHSMMFLSIERTRHPTEVITAEEFYGFADHTGLFFSETGVCAGPKPLIDEFLAAIFDGAGSPEVWNVELPAEVRELLDKLPEVLEYGLLGLLAWAATRSIWLEMSRAHEALMERLAHEKSSAARALHERLVATWDRMEGERIAIDYERDVHFQVYVDCYEQPWRDVQSRPGPPTFVAAIAPPPEGPVYDKARAELGAQLAAQLGGSSEDSALATAMASILTTYLRAEQGVLVRAEAIQRAINTHLGRPHPTRPLEVRDFLVGHRMQGGVVGTFPYVLDTIAETWGVTVRCTKEAILIDPPSAPAVETAMSATARAAAEPTHEEAAR